MDLQKFSAADVVWQKDAQCNGASFNFTPEVESKRGLAVAQTWCNLCPVQVDCLAYALLYHMSGYWGGTDTKTRRLLSYPRNRVKCPACQSKALITTTDGHEICQHCGVSWTSCPPLSGEADGHDDRDRSPGAHRQPV